MWSIWNGNILLFEYKASEESNELNFNWIIKMLTQFHAIANKKRVGKLPYIYLRMA